MNRFLHLLILLSGVFFSAQNYTSNSIPAQLTKNANAVIRNENTALTLHSIDRLDIQYEQVLTILNRSGEKFSTVSIPYDPQTKVWDIKVNVIDSGGKIVKSYSKKDFTDVSHSPSFALYMDNRILYLKISGTNFPYTIQHSYSASTTNTVFLPEFTPFFNFDISLEKSSLSFNNKAGIKLNTKITNTQFGSVVKEENAGKTVFTYHNVAALKEELMAPSPNILLPKVEFSLEKFNLAGHQGQLSNWNDFGSWYYNNILQPVSKITPEIKAEVAALNLSGSTEEKVKAIYRHMQEKTRYIFVAIGIGGWQPMNADDVRKKGYGDCKALSNYMKTMLEAAEIPSYYCKIKDDASVQTFDKDFPKMGGNHIVLMVPAEKDTIWLENTSQQVAFNHLNYTSKSRNVLAVDPEGIKVIKTPSNTSENSREVLKAEIQLKEDNTIAASAKFAFSGGQYDRTLTLVNLPETDLQNLLKQQHFNLKIEELKVANLKNDRDRGELSYNMDFNTREFSRKIGHDMFFPVMPFYSATYFEDVEDRALPFQVSFPYHDDYEITYILPEGYKLNEVPAAQTLKSEFGQYEINFKNNGNKVVVKRTIKVKEGLYPREKYRAYAEFRTKATNFDNIKLLITKN